MTVMYTSTSFEVNLRQYDQKKHLVPYGLKSPSSPDQLRMQKKPWMPSWAQNISHLHLRAVTSELYQKLHHSFLRHSRCSRAIRATSLTECKLAPRRHLNAKHVSKSEWAVWSYIKSAHFNRADAISQRAENTSGRAARHELHQYTFT